MNRANCPRKNNTMSTASKLLVLALGTSILAAAVPTVAEACGPYGLTAKQKKALEREQAERRRLMTLRTHRASRCVAGTIRMKSEEDRRGMSGLPWDAPQRRSVEIHYPLFSEDDYAMSTYMDGLTLHRDGFAWGDINAEEEHMWAFMALRPTGDDEWMVVHDFKSECPQPVDEELPWMDELEQL